MKFITGGYKLQPKIALIPILILVVTSIVYAQSVPQVGKLFSYAEGLFSVKEYGLARESYLKVIYLYPKNQYQDDAQFKIGESYTRQGNFWYAIDEWQKLIDKYPASKLVPKAKKKIKMAKIMLQDQERPILTTEERTANKYISFGKKFLNEGTEWTDYGIIYVKEKFKKAIYWFSKVIEEFPQSHLSAKAQYNKGEAYFSLANKHQYFKGEAFVEWSWPAVAENYRKAVQEYQKVIDNYPGTLWADKAGIKVGDIYLENLNDKEASIEAYKKVIEKKKMDFNNYYVCYSSTQINYVNSKQFERYVRFANINIQRRTPPLNTIYDRAANKYIDYGRFFLKRSIRKGEFGIVYNKEELDTAIYWFDRVVAEFPDSYLAAKARYYKGETYLNLQRVSDYKKAIDEYQKVVDNYPNTYWANEAGIKIGNIYKDKLVNKKEAIKSYQRVIDMKKNDPDNYYVSYAKTQINYLK